MPICSQHCLCLDLTFHIFLLWPCLLFLHLLSHRVRMFHAIWFMLFVALHRNLAFVTPLTVGLWSFCCPLALGITVLCSIQANLVLSSWLSPWLLPMLYMLIKAHLLLLSTFWSLWLGPILLGCNSWHGDPPAACNFLWMKWKSYLTDQSLEITISPVSDLFFNFLAPNCWDLVLFGFFGSPFSVQCFSA